MNKLLALTRRNDIMLALLLMGIIFMIILPLPVFVIDMLIVINLTIAMVLLMMSVYVGSPLDFAAFPAVLLLSTLFRLALAISTTRLILLQADAGKVVETFGNFVVGGNLIIGMVIFLIITVVQFIVITKGAERVAEVSARFSLDAMPGKQMSIDGDMRAGVIDMDEARRRRGRVEKESQMFGSMDGAMKFVKGDAIAGIIIIGVNLVGGLSVGILQRGLSVGEAAHLYSILTIGDGLVQQIPGLMIALTAGIIVTRVDSEENDANLADNITGQIISKPRSILVAGGIIALFGLVPGFPIVAFLLVSGTLIAIGTLAQQRMDREQQDEDDLSRVMPSTTEAKIDTDENIGGSLAEQEQFSLVMPLLIDMAPRLRELLDMKKLNNELLKVRRALYLDLGVPFPGIHLRFNENITDVNRYLILMNEVPVGQGELLPDMLFYTDNLDQVAMLDIPYQTGEAFLPNRSTIWIEQGHAEMLDKLNLSYFTSAKILTYHLSHILTRYAQDFIGIQETEYLLSQTEQTMPNLTKEAQRVLPIHVIADIFRRVVAENISIRNMRLILEGLVEWGQREKDVVLLTEYIRSELKRYISHKYSSVQNVLAAYILDQDLEEQIRSAIRQTSSGNYLALDPETTRRIVASVKQAVGDMSQKIHTPVLLTAFDIRRYVRKIVEAELYELAVLSYQDLTPEVTVQPLERITL
ncbi:MAG: type III secretion system export apparatus subunit SctV [Gammaproteobacteria bacterium]|nr:type III secretion system export apparatus subunit SctV [Gammaproteobacteria bacterium]MCY4211822.1 type III secretion system export apparatus subunit SctV [Gammaproteobacteria bacterium]MCY4282651.1 type III secretion system export apparatus subunit SctV [Gammaproteobacteria bacterium]MCY4339103.1 type III secretion system export apparatus subunit SctV [Gammaproteobacteria bacterium]